MQHGEYDAENELESGEVKFFFLQDYSQVRWGLARYLERWVNRCEDLLLEGRGILDKRDRDIFHHLAQVFGRIFVVKTQVPLSTPHFKWYIYFQVLKAYFPGTRTSWATLGLTAPQGTAALSFGWSPTITHWAVFMTILIGWFSFHLCTYLFEELPIHCCLIVIHSDPLGSLYDHLNRFVFFSLLSLFPLLSNCHPVSPLEQSLWPSE